MRITLVHGPPLIIIIGDAQGVSSVGVCLLSVAAAVAGRAADSCRPRRLDWDVRGVVGLYEPTKYLLVALLLVYVLMAHLASMSRFWPACLVL